MIGSGLKKYAAEIGLTVKNGVAFGSYGGYMTTLYEGSGYKAAAFAITFTAVVQKDGLAQFLGEPEKKKAYRINKYTIDDQALTIQFTDNPGTMKRVKEYLPMLTAQLQMLGINGTAYCNHCGQPFDSTAAIPVLLDGTAYLMHEACIERANAQNEADKAEKSEAGSVISGSFGALLGGLVGAIPWAVAYYFGWFVGWLGFLIGLAAQKGYELLRGKESRAKPVAVVLSTIICVILVECVTCIIGIKMEIASDPELVAYGFTWSEIIRIFFNMVTSDPEMRGMVLRDLGLGLVFAFLGIFSTARGLFAQHSKNSGKAIRLDI